MARGRHNLSVTSVSVAMRRTSIPLVALVIAVSGCGEAVTSLTPRPAASSSSQGSPAPPDASLGDLDELAWWATENIGFGIIPEAPPDPDPATQPGGYRQLTVGTLDGRITAVLALHPDWSHSYVSGPYGTDVLVANDWGSHSEVFVVSALDGSRTRLFETTEVVAAAALGESGTALYLVEVDRLTGVDSGLTRIPMDGGAAEAIVPGPLMSEPSEVPVYWLTGDPLVGTVVVQSCFGQVACDSTAVDLADGARLSETRLGWPLAASGDLLFADGLGSGQSGWAWDLESGNVEVVPGAWRSVPVTVGATWVFATDDLEETFGPTMIATARGDKQRVPGDEPEGSAIGSRGYDRGTALPPGWVLRFPEARFFMIPDDGRPPAVGQLIHAGTGERVDLAPPQLEVSDGAGCEILAPSRMPDGAAVGTGILELLDGRRTVRWGPSDASVTLAVGWEPPQATGDDPIPVGIRGHAGLAQLVDQDEASRPAITWTEEGCEYAVMLPPDAGLDVAVEYAGRY